MQIQPLSSEASSFKVGQYRHFKGGVYQVVGVARHSETGEELVVYRHDGTLWVRPLGMFFDAIDRDGYHGTRFTYVGDGSSVELADQVK